MYIPPAIFEYYTTDLDGFQFFGRIFLGKSKKLFFFENHVTNGLKNSYICKGIS